MNKFAAIAALESELKQVEIDLCFAMREWDNRDKVTDLFILRGEIIQDLRGVCQ